MKWSVGTGIGVLLIFAVFAALLYQSFSNILLRQEKQYVTDAVGVVSERLSHDSGELTDSNVKPLLSSNFDSVEDRQGASSSLYSDSLFVTLSRKNIGVSVYNLDGKGLFASRRVPIKFDRVGPAERIKKVNGTNVYVRRSAIYTKKNHELRGYVQVTNRLVEYDAARNKLLLIFLVFGLTAVLLCSLLGYILSLWLLRPIDDINETIDKINEAEDGDPVANIRVPKLRYNDELSNLGNLFNDMLDQMQRYIEQQQQFVEDVSHELRTPVAIIQGHLELLNRWGKDNPEVLAESISASLQEINRMKSLVQEMLDLSRAEQVEIHFGKEITDAREVVLQVFNNFKMIKPDFVFVLDDDLNERTAVQMYRNHLEQVLIILLDNAVKYSTERQEIHLSVAKNARYVDIAVQDFGEGISQQNIKRVFNRFYRVDKARSRDKGGNGLGLSIAQRLIEGYHGKLTVESVLGQGSVFRISLPIVQKDSKASDIKSENNGIAK
ncbi:transmembrane histidine kinase [Liquorilactobacillus sucicola DSM 21376 = JCM 15457]|uniref:Signal transduction histidine-protein kinase ArlS n=2 Tax=Liquorilactobacillus sucicola TaxID=519050 RepID=A0A0R2DXD8_9LACO|nr:transmembrane histidine kinase [Liquorilactobacillus sucicola DSM 21376 = JCM 15457]